MLDLREGGNRGTPSSRVVGLNRLPPGYSRSLADPPAVPVRPRPAATIALLRKGADGLEVLLLKRSARTRFIPGAYVFPGGRVEPEDASEGVIYRVTGLTAAEADGHLGTSGADLPGIAFFVAALRETFEETGILLGEDSGQCRSVKNGGEEDGEGRFRTGLRRGSMELPEVLDGLGARLGAGRVSYMAHWVTPVQERYRYDTRFFVAEVPRGCPAFPDGEELVEHLWVTPAEAMRRNEGGSLPMVFPTLFTLEALAAFRDPAEALLRMGGPHIPRLLPIVEDTPTGIRMTLQDLSSGGGT